MFLYVTLYVPTSLCCVKLLCAGAPCVRLPASTLKGSYSLPKMSIITNDLQVYSYSAIFLKQLDNAQFLKNVVHKEVRCVYVDFYFQRQMNLHLLL